MPTDYIGFAYALTIASGGIMGYVKSGSVPSLAAGLLFGTALTIGAVLQTRNSNPTPNLVLSGILTGLMGYRFVSSWKVMPAGVVCGISGFMAVRYIQLAMEPEKKYSQ